MIINSSYVLIRHHPFRTNSKQVEARPSATRINILWHNYSPFYFARQCVSKICSTICFSPDFLFTTYKSPRSLPGPCYLSLSYTFYYLQPKILHAIIFSSISSSSTGG